MGRLWRILMAATLVVHLTVGCCLHHAHGCEDKGRPSSAHGDATHGGQCPDSGADHTHHGPQDCRGAKCSFVASSRTVGSSFVAPAQTSFTAFSDGQPFPVGIGSQRHVQVMGRHLLPVRLHLANQVLLI